MTFQKQLLESPENSATLKKPQQYQTKLKLLLLIWEEASEQFFLPNLVMGERLVWKCSLKGRSD